MKATTWASTGAANLGYVLHGRIVGFSHWYRGADGKLQRDGHIEVYCPECDDVHTHGWWLTDGFCVARHKAAHCHNPNSKFKGVGYYVALDRKAKHIWRPGDG